MRDEHPTATPGTGCRYDLVAIGRTGRRHLPARSTASGWRRCGPSRSSSAAARPTSPSRRRATAAASPSSPAPGATRSAATSSGGAARLRRRRRFVAAGRRAADAGDVLRGLPAGRLPALLLPLPDRARPAHRRRTTCRCDAIRDAGVYWSTVTGLSQEPSRAAHFAAWEARGRRTHTVLDLDYRPMFWADPAEASAQVGKALEHVTVAVGNREECEVAVGETDPQRAADALLERGRRARRRQAGPQGRARRDRATSGSRCRPSPSRSSTASAPATRSAARSCHGLLERLGPAPRSSSSPTSPAPSSPRRLECSTAMPTEARGRAAPSTDRAVTPPCRGGTMTVETQPTGRVADLTEIRAREPRPHRRGAGRPGAAARSLGDGRPAAPRRRRPPGPRRARRARRRAWRWPAGATCSSGSPPRSRGPGSTACSAPPTSSTTCCCWAPSTTRSSSAR